jgi:hypothetical protein
MHLLVSPAHLPISRDRGCHCPAHLSGVRGPENVIDARLPGSGAPLSGPLDRFSTGDAHLPSKKMHGKATPRTFLKKVIGLREEFALRLGITM